MDPKEQLNIALKEAMKNKDNLRRDVIRMTLNAIKQVEVDAQKTLTPEEVVEVIQKEAKKRRDTIAELEKAGRIENLEQERQELVIVESFLPQQLTKEELSAIARAVIQEVGATTAADMGKIMGALMPKVKGRADGKLVNQVVRELLGN